MGSLLFPALTAECYITNLVNEIEQKAPQINSLLLFENKNPVATFGKKAVLNFPQ